MLQFIVDNYSTILLGALLLAVVAIVIVHLIRKKQSGKSVGCDCCSGCPGEPHCHKQ